MYALKYAQTHKGQELWFEKMVQIGPMTTADIDKRATFETREEANNCPAMFHSLAMFDVVEVHQ